MLKMLTGWLDKRGSVRMIHRVNFDTHVEEDYLKRYYLLRFNGFNLFLHQFWSSDPDHVHDHPFSNFALILKGGYHEFQADGTSVFRKAGWFRFRSAESFHRVAIGPHAAGQAWTLFATGTRRREWGFLTPEGWLPYYEYGEKYGSPIPVKESDYKIVGHFFPKVVWLGE